MDISKLQGKGPTETLSVRGISSALLKRIKAEAHVKGFNRLGDFLNAIFESVLEDLKKTERK